MKDSKSFEACVVGSGPSSVAAVCALVSQGYHVLVLDVGNKIDDKAQKLKSSFFNKDKNAWTPSELRLLTGTVKATPKGVEIKRSFGSDFAYQIPELFPKQTYENCDLLPSFAKGGFSTVWGCSVLPYRNRDLINWPLSEADLAIHYQEVLNFAQVYGKKDVLDSEFDTYTNDLCQCTLSEQAKYVEYKLKKNFSALSRKGLRFGSARILFNKFGRSKSCVRCGLCLYGCPKNTLFSSDGLLDEFIERGQVTYIDKHFVDSFEESLGEVKVFSTELSTNLKVEFLVKRLFIGAGVIPTANIVMNSSSGRISEVTLLDSQYFLQPILFTRCFARARTEDSVAFSQLNLELENDKVDPRNVHLQLYTYSPMLGEALESAIPFFRFFPEVLKSVILGFFGVIQGYLHSDSSGRIRIRKNFGQNVLMLVGQHNCAQKPIILRCIRFFMANFLKVGFFPIPFALNVTRPGRGFHVGGSFPMKENPSFSETDIYGRPMGLQRVHIIDSSIFPTIPAATITLTAMANAHRIASKKYE